MGNNSEKCSNASSYDSMFNGSFNNGERGCNDNNFNWIIFIIIFFLIIKQESCFTFLNGCFQGQECNNNHHKHGCNEVGSNGNILWIFGILVVLWLLRRNGEDGNCGTDDNCKQDSCKDDGWNEENCDTGNDDEDDCDEEDPGEENCNEDSSDQKKCDKEDSNEKDCDEEDSDEEDCDEEDCDEEDLDEDDLGEDDLDEDDCDEEDTDEEDLDGGDLDEEDSSESKTDELKVEAEFC